MIQEFLASVSSLVGIFNSYAKANPVLAGVMSLWGAAAVTWLLRGVPTKVWGFLKHQLTTSVSLNSQATGDNFELFLSFLGWFNNSKYVKYSRNLMIIGVTSWARQEMTGDHNEGMVNSREAILTGIGPGSHLFWFRGWPYVVRLAAEKPDAYNNLLYTAIISTPGRSHRRIHTMLSQFSSFKRGQDTICFKSFNDRIWTATNSVKPRSLDTVMMNHDLKQFFLDDIQEFLESRQWYESRGIPYKRVYILHGPSGTGKTSFIKALAGYFKKDLYNLDLNKMSDSSLSDALSQVAPGHFVIAEDFDSCDALSARKGMKVKVHNREGMPDRVTPQRAQGAPAPDEVDRSPDYLKMSFLTLSGALNALDGITPLDGAIIFMTTNDISDIDGAFLRAGRADVIKEIPLLQDQEIREYARMVFPEVVLPSDVVFDDAPGCNIQEAYMLNKTDPEKFLSCLAKKEPSQ